MAAEEKRELQKRVVRVELEVEVIEDKLWMPGFWQSCFTLDGEGYRAEVGHTFGLGGGSVFLRQDEPERTYEQGRYAVVRGRALADALIAAQQKADEAREEVS